MTRGKAGVKNMCIVNLLLLPQSQSRLPVVLSPIFKTCS